MASNIPPFLILSLGGCVDYGEDYKFKNTEGIKIIKKVWKIFRNKKKNYKEKRLRNDWT